MTPRAILLVALGFLSFASVYNNIVVSPVLVDIGRDFGVSTGVAGLLVTAYGLPGVVISILAGPLSDRYGRKPFLVWGTVIMSALTVLGGFAPAFAHLLLTRVVAGIGSALTFPNVQAVVADNFAYRERGRAMSTVIGMNQLATIVGVPLAGLIAEATSWRLSFEFVGVLGLLSAVAVVLFLVDNAPRTEAVGTVELYSSLFRDVSVRGAVASSCLGSIFWFTWITYVVAFFETRFGLPTAAASAVVLTTGLGILAGSQLGGRLGDRIGHRVIVGWAIVFGGLLLLVETNLVADLLLATAVNFLISLASGARFATNTALLSEQAPSARGTLLALNSSIVSLGIVAGTSVGGLLIDGYGFWAIGVMSSLAAFGAAVVVWRFVTERTAELAAGEATE